MATFCKACGKPVRQGILGWVHYDEHGTHPIDLFVSSETNTHSFQATSSAKPPTASRHDIPWGLIILPTSLILFAALVESHPVAAVLALLSGLPLLIAIESYLKGLQS